MALKILFLILYIAIWGIITQSHETDALNIRFLIMDWLLNRYLKIRR